MILKLKLNVNIGNDLSEKDGSYEELLPHFSSREDMLCAEEIRLKFDSLNLSKLTISLLILSFYSTFGILEDCFQELLY
jgi:hypothetical protein